MPESPLPNFSRPAHRPDAPADPAVTRRGASREQVLREAIELFYFGYRAFTARPDRILAARGLGRVHHRILYFVGRDPGLSVNGLLGVLGVTKQALNAPLRRLTEAKLITAEVSPNDRRIRLLSLTREGRQLEARLTGTQMRHLDQAFDAEDPKAAAAWRRLMKAIAAS